VRKIFKCIMCEVRMKPVDRNTPKLSEKCPVMKTPENVVDWGVEYNEREGGV
jgi:hypothetical protein